ncbi:MAG: hypothetical protein ACXWP0_08820 [Ktedonobacterales bacterium]
MPRELYDSVLEAPSINPAAYTNAGATGGNVDLAGYESALVVVTTGTITDGTHTLVLQEADDNGSGAPGTFAAVAASDMLGSIPGPLVTGGTFNNKAFAFAYIGLKRWLRVTSSATGSTTGGIYSAAVVRGHTRHASTRTAQP